MSAAAAVRASVTSIADTTQHAQSNAATVTSRPAGGTSALERKRQQRERERVAQRQTYFSRTDWSLFLNPRTISQKAGCQPNDLRKLALRELVDNGADAGAEVIIYPEGDGWIVSDDGPGMDPDDVARLFSVNRTLVSSKQLRLPTRGMVGNGLRVVMGAIAAFEGNLTVTTRGRHMRLAVDRETGLTDVTEDTEAPFSDGMTVFISLPGDSVGYGSLATETARLAEFGRAYKGPTSPHWYAARDLRDLMQQAPEETTVADVADWFGIDLPDERFVRELDPLASAQLLSTLRLCVPLVQPARLGEIGEAAYKNTFYHKVNGFTRSATSIPYVCEAWATCRRSEQRGAGSAQVKLLLNRTVSASQLSASSGPQGVRIQGCGLLRTSKGKTGHYDITLSVISPYIELATDGKEPALAPFGEGLVAVIEKACAKAHHAMDKPPGSMTIIEAAEQVMPNAYLIASANGTLPANARQIYYAARPRILALTGRKELIDSYFTQNVLPNYVDAHHDAHEWDVVFDDRGRFIEPHTGRSVGLGTVSVREYLGERAAPPSPASIAPGLMATTTGPENRYRDVLFVEKEGFNALLAHALIAERFDIAITSTKGMSNTALRRLLDGLVSRGMERVFVLHDFGAAGFSIFGTLGTDSRRYTFTNQVNVIDLGLRLDDVRDMNLSYEEYAPAYWDSRLETLERHGASQAEITILETHRVELNAMPSDMFVRFLEQKLVEHGVKKVVPDEDVLTAHARNVMERALTNQALDDLRTKAHTAAHLICLPDDLKWQVQQALQAAPERPWDLVTAEIASDIIAAAEWDAWAASVASDLDDTLSLS